MEKIRLGACTVHLLPVIKGLKSETEKVRRACEEVKPDKLLVSISKEEVEGLRRMPVDFVPELSRYEEIYANGLSRFGEVAAPPPCYVAAIELGDHKGIPIIPIDLDEQAYSELYCAVVGGTALFRHSTRTWIMKRRRFSDDGPEAFVLAWDRAVNNYEGFRIVEQKRAERMAKGIREACTGTATLLAIVELERADEVADLLRDTKE